MLTYHWSIVYDVSVASCESEQGCPSVGWSRRIKPPFFRGSPSGPARMTLDGNIFKFEHTSHWKHVNSIKVPLKPIEFDQSPIQPMKNPIELSNSHGKFPIKSHEDPMKIPWIYQQTPGILWLAVLLMTFTWTTLDVSRLCVWKWGIP